MNDDTGMPDGVQPLDHTADVGMDVVAPTMATLFDRAALGMMAFLAGDDLTVTNHTGETTPPRTDGSSAAATAAEAGEPLPALRRPIDVEAADPALLLVDWLREILLHCEAAGRRYRGAELDTIEDTHLRGEVSFVPWTDGPVREIKGVTYHDLHVDHLAGSWTARVVFDV